MSCARRRRRRDRARPRLPPGPMGHGWRRPGPISRPCISTTRRSRRLRGGRVLPADVANELLSGLSWLRRLRFHAQRWPTSSACATEMLQRSAPTFVAPAATDHDDIAGVAASDGARGVRRAERDDRRSSLHLPRRPDRVVQNRWRLLAFDDLLTTRPEWRERVVFGAFVYPSRESLPEYRAYTRSGPLARRINELGDDDGRRSSSTPTTTSPVMCRPPPLRRTLVNPVRDGLNLSPRKRPVNERHGAVALSREAGLCGRNSSRSARRQPLRRGGTADVLAEALAMGDDDASVAPSCCASCGRRRPQDWLEISCGGAEPVDGEPAGASTARIASRRRGTGAATIVVTGSSRDDRIIGRRRGLFGGQVISVLFPPRWSSSPARRCRTAARSPPSHGLAAPPRRVSDRHACIGPTSKFGLTCTRPDCSCAPQGLGALAALSFGVEAGGAAGSVVKLTVCDALSPAHALSLTCPRRVRLPDAPSRVMVTVRRRLATEGER